MIIPEEEFWLPISIGYAMGEPIVTISRLSERPIGFLSDADLRNHGKVFKLPLNDIEENSFNTSGIDSLIFHLPRSGSTAVAKAVAKLSESTCFFEPAALDQLLSPQFDHFTNKQAALKKLLGLYGSVSNHQAAKVFIKLSSWSTLSIQKYRRAMPATPFLFAYRNPVEVLVQVLQRPTGWMQSPAREEIEKILGLRTEGSLQEYSCKILEMFCQKILQTDPSPTLINHSVLRESSIAAVTQVFLNKLSESELLRMNDSFDADSEDWQAVVKYSADSQQLMEQATSELIEACERLVTPYIQQIESRQQNG